MRTLLNVALLVFGTLFSGAGAFLMTFFVWGGLYSLFFMGKDDMSPVTAALICMIFAGIAWMIILGGMMMIQKAGRALGLENVRRRAAAIEAFMI